MTAAPTLTFRDLLIDIAASGITDELEELASLLCDLAAGPDSESSDEMLQARVHDQLDVICRLLGRDVI